MKTKFGIVGCGFLGGIVADAFDSATMNLNVTNSTSTGNNRRKPARHSQSQFSVSRSSPEPNDSS